MEKRKKGVLILMLILFISVLLLISVISSVKALTEEEEIPLVYKWLINHTKNQWNTLKIKQDAFSLLALKCNETYSIKGNKSLYNLSYYNSSQKIRCWKEQGKPSSSSECKLVETSLAKIALNEMGDNTTYIDKWLIMQNKTFTNRIYWFLQIDIARGKQATCEIMYGDVMQNVSIHADKTVSILSSTPGCVESVFGYPDSGNYWFKIKQDSYCYSQEYLIKCFGNESSAEPVTATLLYKNDTSNPRTTFYVSSEISQGTLGFTNEIGEEEQHPGIMQINIPSYCLADGSVASGDCNYEGTAWAVYAWQREGKSDYVNMFVPYLVVYSSFNEQFFPESFLSTLIGGEYTEKLLTEQQRIRKTGSRDYWSFWLNQPLLYGQFYDTPKAVLALGEYTDVGEVKDYLLGHLANDHSWVNTFDASPGKDTHRDTAFILWVFWPNYCPGISEGGSNESCVGQGSNYFCKEGDACGIDEFPWPNLICPEGFICCSNLTSNSDECIDSGGECLNESCPSGYGYLNLSCSETDFNCCRNFLESSCYDWPGADICFEGETCPIGMTVQTSEGACCLAECLSGQGDQDCFSQGGTTCGTGEICWSYTLQQEVSFIPALESNCCTQSCIKDDSCSAIGKDCSESPYGPEYRCVDSSGGYGSMVNTRDVQECCLDDCKKNCASDKLCSSGQTCSQYDTESVESNCCLTECQGGKSLLWLFIVIIIIVLALLVYFFVLRKKQKKPKEEGEEFGEFPEFEKPKEPSGQGFSFFKPFQKKEETELKVPEKAPKEEKNILPQAKKQKSKSKAEQELEETLGKLKKMTKK